MVLLFLNNVKKIRIEVISDNGSVKHAEVHRTVEVVDSGLKKIQITDDLKSKEEIFITTEVDLANLPEQQRAELSQLSAQLKVRSKVMVAAALLETGGAGLRLPANLSGRVAVMLPLPRSQTTNTNLPVIVNGFFALGENRRVLKMESSDDHSAEVS